MPEFTTVSIQEAKLRTTPGRPGQFINEYADYIQSLPKGQAGRLTIGEGEKHTAIRRRLVTTAKTMNIPLIVKRSGKTSISGGIMGKRSSQGQEEADDPETGDPGVSIFRRRSVSRKAVTKEEQKRKQQQWISQLTNWGWLSKGL